MRTTFLISMFGLLLCSIGISAQSTDPNKTAIAKGVDYLKIEVPKWKAEHPCYSCHNNGDATRALLIAASRSVEAALP